MKRNYTIEFTQIRNELKEESVRILGTWVVLVKEAQEKYCYVFLLWLFTSQGKTGEEGRSDWKFEVL
jgi:hypothetical protein